MNRTWMHTCGTGPLCKDCRTKATRRLKRELKRDLENIERLCQAWGQKRQALQVVSGR